MNLIVAFLTGLTTGGLSCLAVQGGLLASSLAHQLEEDLRAGTHPGFRPRLAQPIALFLAAKFIAYTLLGFLLGALGSALQLTPLLRAILMMAIGIFMLGNGLRILKVHPIFRYFVFEPPPALTRFIHRRSKGATTLVTPLFLGALTVLIPCGVTQAMMAAALGSGDPIQGMAIMSAFTLGTTPVFFTVAYFATRLGAALEKQFTRFVAVTVIVLGLVSLDFGLNLAGSPVSFTSLVSRLSAQPARVDPTLAPAGDGGSALHSYVITVKNDGYSPQTLHVTASQPVRLIWVTRDVTSCALDVVVPGVAYEKALPHTGQEILDIPPQARGTVMRYSCSMGMYAGQLIFDQD